MKITRMLVFIESDWGIFTPPIRDGRGLDRNAEADGEGCLTAGPARPRHRAIDRQVSRRKPEARLNPKGLLLSGPCQTTQSQTTQAPHMSEIQ